jgi:hypothetical protein
MATTVALSIEHGPRTGSTPGPQTGGRVLGGVPCSFSRLSSEPRYEPTPAQNVAHERQLIGVVVHPLKKVLSFFDVGQVLVTDGGQLTFRC